MDDFEPGTAAWWEEWELGGYGDAAGGPAGQGFFQPHI
jgi:hypothetical protein